MGVSRAEGEGRAIFIVFIWVYVSPSDCHGPAVVGRSASPHNVTVLEGLAAPVTVLLTLQRPRHQLLSSILDSFPVWKYVVQITE